MNNIDTLMQEFTRNRTYTMTARDDRHIQASLKCSRIDVDSNAVGTIDNAIISADDNTVIIWKEVDECEYEVTEYIRKTDYENNDGEVINSERP